MIQQMSVSYVQANKIKPWAVHIDGLDDGQRVGDYVYEAIDMKPGKIIRCADGDRMSEGNAGVWRYRPIRESEPDKAFEKKPESRLDELVMQAFSESEDEKTTYRAIRVLVIEGTKEFVRETMKRSKIDEKVTTAFLEQGGTVGYRSTKFEKVVDVEEAELWSE